MSNEVNVLNIPAFQRKHSLSAKARKLSTTTKRKTVRKKRITKTPRQIEERSINNLFRPSRPSEEIFPSPTIEEAEKTNYTATRSSFREMQICGRCEGYFDKIDVAVIQLTSAISTGDSIIFETDNGLFEQKIDSMQLNRQDISIAHAGDDIGLKALARPKVGGSVYKVI